LKRRGKTKISEMAEQEGRRSTTPEKKI